MSVLRIRSSGLPGVIKKMGIIPYCSNRDWYDSSYTGEVPYLSCYVSKNEQEDKLYVMLINRHPEANLPITFQLDGFFPQDKYAIWKLTGPKITSQNDGSPGLVNIINEIGSLGGSDFKYLCPANSVVVIEMNRMGNFEK